MTNYESLIAHYFKNPILQKYINKTLQTLGEGNSCVPIESEDLEELKKEKEIAPEISLDKSFIAFQNHFSFQRYFGYELAIADFVKQKVSASSLHLDSRKKVLLENKSLIESLFLDFKKDPKLSDSENIDWQKIAVLVSFLQDFYIITGGPGTGKTTTVSKLLALIYSVNPESKVALTAQTGKAAARLKESLDNSRQKLNLKPELNRCFDTIEPKTLHRLLGYKRKSVDFKHNTENPLPYDLIIVDESSMVDLPMMAKLMQAVGENTKLILLGDKEQLPSVELGAVFGDLCASLGENLNLFSADFCVFLGEFLEANTLNNYLQNEPGLLTNSVVQLRRSYRFSALDGLGKFAKAILEREKIELSDYSQQKDNQSIITYIDWSDSMKNTIFSLYEEYIFEANPLKAIQSFNLLRVLAATHEGSRGVKELNLKIEQWLESKKWINCKDVFYMNRPILITKNDYNLGLYNGDVGIIRLDEKGEKKVFFEDGLGGVKTINPSFLSNYESVFAMTIHKSQGSEFKNVLLVLPNSKESEVLNQQLIYTAVTRAKEKVFILGDQAVFEAGISRKNVRLSNLTNLLKS